MENEKPKLKPCPFCGSEECEVDSEVAFAEQFFVLCPSCAAEGPWQITESGAVSLWNDRPTDTVKEQLAEALEKLHSSYCLGGEYFYDDVAINAAEEALVAYREEQAK